MQSDQGPCRVSRTSEPQLPLWSKTIKNIVVIFRFFFFKKNRRCGKSSTWPPVTRDISEILELDDGKNKIRNNTNKTWERVGR